LDCAISRDVRGGGRIAAIEVKHKRPGFWAGCDKACFGVEKETDIKRLGEFEQGFGIPVWFAFFDGWNYDRIDLWRIAKRSELQVYRNFEAYLLVDANKLPLVSSAADLLKHLA
jgi:hypothetical protein